MWGQNVQQIGPKFRLMFGEKLALGSVQDWVKQGCRPLFVLRYLELLFWSAHVPWNFFLVALGGLGAITSTKESLTFNCWC